METQVSRVWTLVALLATVAILGSGALLAFVARGGNFSALRATEEIDVIDLADVEAANRHKMLLASVPGVREAAMQASDLNGNVRWVIFGFNEQRDKVIPLSKSDTTLDWINDYKTFTDSLPDDDVAFAVYAFDYWLDDDDYSRKPVLLTWIPEGCPLREQALAGYYLGNIILKANLVHAHLRLTQELVDGGYQSLCSSLGIERCSLVRSFHDCMFTDDPSRKNPCNKTACKGAEPDQTGIPEPCCEYISKYCSDPRRADYHGCKPISLHAIQHACEAPVIEEVPIDQRVELYMQCELDCLNPCLMFDDKTELYLKFSQCNNDGVNQCYPGAKGFHQMECCGAASICGEEMYQDPFSCEDVSHHGCTFTSSNLCPLIEEIEFLSENATSSSNMSAPELS